MKPRLLFVDDRSKRIHSALAKYGQDFDIRIAPSVKEAFRLISEGNWSVVSLDHDLNGDDYQDPRESTSGMEIVRHLVVHSWPYEEKPLFVIHASNIFAARDMERLLKEVGFNVVRKRFDYDEGVIEWMPLCTRTNEPV